MKPCMQLPAEKVSDWRRVERCMHDSLAFTGADGAAIEAITTRVKFFFDLRDRDCASEREARQLTADLLLDRSAVEFDAYDARSPEVVP